MLSYIVREGRRQLDEVLEENLTRVFSANDRRNFAHNL